MKEVGKELHKIKPQLKMFGLTELLDRLLRMEVICKKEEIGQDDKTELNSDFLVLKNQLEFNHQHIKRIISDMPN